MPAQGQWEGKRSILTCRTTWMNATCSNSVYMLRLPSSGDQRATAAGFQRDVLRPELHGKINSHGITELYGLEEIFGDHLVQTPAKAGTLDQVAQVGAQTECCNEIKWNATDIFHYYYYWFGFLELLLLLFGAGTE